MKIAMVYHIGEKVHPWSTPLGLGKAFESSGHSITTFDIFDPQNVDLSDLRTKANTFDLIFFCVAGPSDSLDKELKLLRESTKTKIFMEMGDDLPFSNFFSNRVYYIDRGFTPDVRCLKKYNTNNVEWMPCWCDDMCFRYDENIPRTNKCVTTCGERLPYTPALKRIFGEKFENRRVWYFDNIQFYNSGTVSFQHARYNEITRRIFEAGGSKLAILTNRISPETKIYDLFLENEDILYYDSIESCVEKMNLLLTNTKYAATIAGNMYEKIRNNHLVQHRVKTILEKV